MRTYIFTERERRIINDFLNKKIRVTHGGLSQIRTRLKTSSLVEDIDLLMRLFEALAESESTIST